MNYIDLINDEQFHDLIHSESTDKKAKTLNKFLRDNKEKTIRLYHGTSSDLPIIEEGLKPTSRKTAKSLQSGHGYVYLSIYPSMAFTFGEMAYPKKDITVYAVDIPIKNLKVDVDQLKNKRYWGNDSNIGSTLGHSIIYGHGARVKGWIQSYMITKVIK